MEEGRYGGIGFEGRMSLHRGGGGDLYFGFGSSLNGPYFGLLWLCGFAAGRGVLTSRILAGTWQGPALRAVALRLQAKYRSPP